MANFVLLRALGWALKSRLLSSEMSTWDSRWPKVPNFAEGSSHVATGQVVLHGAGADIAPLVSSDLRAHVSSGHFLEIDSGAALTMDAGSTILLQSTMLVDHTSGALGEIHWNAGAIADWLSGSFAIFEAGALAQVKSGGELRAETGSIVRLLGSTLISDKGTGGGNGTITLGATAGAYAGNGHLVVGANGDVIFQNGSVATMQAGAVFNVAGSHTNPATINVTGDGSTSPSRAAQILFTAKALLSLDDSQLLLDNSATLNITDAASAAIVGDLSLGFTSTTSQVTRFNPMVRTGSRAYEQLRTIQLTASDFPGGTATITASQADVWMLPSSGLGAGTNILQTTQENFTYSFIIRGTSPSSQGGDVAVQDHAGVGVLGTFLAVGGAPVENAAGAVYLNVGSLGKPRMIAVWDGAGGAFGTPTFTP